MKFVKEEQKLAFLLAASCTDSNELGQLMFDVRSKESKANVLRCVVRAHLQKFEQSKNECDKESCRLDTRFTLFENEVLLDSYYLVTTQFEHCNIEIDNKDCISFATFSAIICEDYIAHYLIKSLIA